MGENKIKKEKLEMKNTNKKGFTLVELVIVIAVIAILAAVLIPTFTSVINRANQSAALQKWKAAVDEAYVEYVADYHEVPKSVFVNGSAITFGGEHIGNNGATDEYKQMTTDGYVVLDLTNKVYLVWVAGTNGGYEVATTYGAATLLNTAVVAE